MIGAVFDGPAGEGVNTVRWDGTTENGLLVASGVYIYRLRAFDTEYAKQLVIVRN